MRTFPECHPERGEGSQVLSGTGYRDVTSRWCEPRPAPYFLGLRFLDRLRRFRNDMEQRPAENWYMGSCRSHVGFGLVAGTEIHDAKIQKEGPQAPLPGHQESLVRVNGN